MEEITTITRNVPAAKNVKQAKVIIKNGPVTKDGITLAVPVPEQVINFSVDPIDIADLEIENENLKAIIRDRDAEIRRLKSDLAELKVEARRKAKG